MEFNVLLETIIDGKIEYLIEYKRRLGIYRLNEGYKLLVGKMSTGVNYPDMFAYCESPGCLIVNENTDAIDVEPVVARISSNGYVEIDVPALGRTDNAHRIVAFSYCKKETVIIEGEFVKFDVDHINGDKQNNRPENLEYTIPLINQYRAVVNKYKGASDRFIKELTRVFDEADPEYKAFALKKLKEELDR